MFVVLAAVFFLTLAAYGGALWLFPRMKLLDFPERYGLTRTRRLPYPTGIVALVIFLCAFAALTPFGMKEGGVIIAVLLLGVTSFIDDRTPLPTSVRLLIQVLVATIVFVTGSRMYTITSPVGGILKLDSIVFEAGIFGSLPLLSGIFTLVWLGLTMNALNWHDGIPGQVSVISTIGFLMLGFLAYFRNGEPDIAMIAFVLAAIAGAGILFDFPPPKMLLGDSGAMFFGFTLGLLGVYHGGKIATVFLALGIPLIDAIFVGMKRILLGTSPFKGGEDHLHHLLLRRGWTPRQIISLTAVTGSVFGFSALFMDTTEKAIALVILAIGILGLTMFASKKN